MGSGFLEEAELAIPGSIFRLHFSGLLAGEIRLSRSSSTEPITEIWIDDKCFPFREMDPECTHNSSYQSFKIFPLYAQGIIREW